jgi:hypothetical protein
VDEILVSLTDYLLALESALFACVLLETKDGWREIRQFFAVFFAFTALASLTGGTYHGFFSSFSSTAAGLLWSTTVVALGVVAFAGWSIGACLLFVQPIKGRVVKCAFIEFLIYSIYAVAVDQRFWVAIANYIPAVVFLAFSLAHSYRRHPELPILAGLLGLAVTVVAAAIQRIGLSLELVYLNHNATYHLVQAIGLFLIFRGAIFLARTPFNAARS